MPYPVRRLFKRLLRQPHAAQARTGTPAGYSGVALLTGLMLIIACVSLLTIAPQAWAQGFFPNQASSAGLANSQSNVVQTPQVRAELVALAPDGIQAGETIYLGLLFEHADGWHTYWKNPGDSGLPTELQWQLPEGWTAGEIEWPSPLKLRIGELANYGYEGRRLLPVPVTIPADWQAKAPANPFEPPSAVSIELQANWLVCKLECIPESGSFSLSLPIEVSSALYAQDFEQARRDRPIALPQAQATGAKPGSYAAAQGEQLTVRLEGLPPELHEQALELFIDEPYVLQHGARAHTGWQQRWEDGAWIAELPLSPDRGASPSDQHLNVVVTRLSHSEGGDWDPAQPRHNSATQAIGWELQVPITAGWQSSFQAQPSPALLQALADNQQAATASAAVSANNNASTNGNATSLPATDWNGGQWAWMLLFALMGGAILNLMPCVFPILAIKALSIAQHSHLPAARQRSAWAYGAGVVLSFAVLGASVLVLRSFGTQLGWGFQLQSPWFVAAMALLFGIMGLALTGAVQFGVWLPQRWRHAGAGQGTSAAFGSGVLAALVASPCTGPFMGAALGAALAFPLAAALSIFVVMGIGMALPLMALVWFPQLINRLPKPGAWMDTFRMAMAFPMFATVVWLLWVLALQVGINGMVAWLAVLWALSMVLWLLGKRPTASRHWALHLIWLLALALPLAVTLWSGRLFVHSLDAPMPVPAATSSAPGAWQVWSAQSQADHLQAQRPVFVDFTASWCITCQYNKATTLADADILADFTAANVQLLRADWTRQNPDITQALSALGRSGVPTYALHVPGQQPVVMTEIIDKGQLRALLHRLR